MNPEIYIGIGEIIDFEIHLIDGEALSASMELKINDDYLVFGGANLFSSIPNSGVDLVGHFVKRCFEVCSVDKTRDLEGHLVKIAMEDDRIVGISSLMNDDFFYPAREFEVLRPDIINPYSMNLFKAVPPKSLSAFLRSAFSGLEGLSEVNIDEVSQMFYRTFGESDSLPTLFRKDIFIDLGAYLTYYKVEVASSEDESIFDFKFYLLDNPQKTGFFQLSSKAHIEIVNSETNFRAFIKDQITAIDNLPDETELGRIKMQPMETAPKDGRIVLLETPQGYFTAKWMGEYTDDWTPCRWQIMKGNEMSRFGNLYEEVEQPTGWAPIE